MTGIKLIKEEDVKRGWDHDKAVEMGFFNQCETLRVALEAGKWQTISVHLPNGAFVTFSFCPDDKSSSGFNCCDIHTTLKPGPNTRHDDSTIYKHHVLGFDYGGTPLDSRKKEQVPRPIGLLTLLLADSHYEDGSEANPLDDNTNKD